jgi:hypothetical protein
VAAGVIAAGCGAPDNGGATRATAPDGWRERITVTDADYRAPRAGVLPATGVTHVGGVALPPGHLVKVDRSKVASPAKAPRGPVAWVSDARLAGIGSLWHKLAAQFPDTGLWPLALESSPSDPGGWWDSDLDPTMSRQPGELGGVDVESTLARWWAEAMPPAADLEDEAFAAAVDHTLTPFGPAFPGLAPAHARVERARTTTVPLAGGHLALVAVERPADAPSVLGWTGPINYYNDIGPLTVVLRSWERRYGAVVVGLGSDTLTLVARRPPRTERDALALAAEHFAACPDSVLQGSQTIVNYASLLRGREAWRFWWD